MASVSIENLLKGLSDEDLKELAGDVDPSVETPAFDCNTTTRYFDKPRRSKSRYDIKSMISIMEKKSRESIDGDNYLPLKYRDWKKEGKPDRKKHYREEKVELSDELQSMMEDITNDDIAEIAAVLGLHSLVTQEESFAAESEKLGHAIMKFGLRKPGIIQGKKPKSIPDMLQTPDHVQITVILRKLKCNDPTLTEIAMNNYKDVDNVLVEVAKMLRENKYVKKLAVANTQMKPSVCAHFIETMKINRTLECINMESNYLTGEIISKLMAVLEGNKSLKELRLANQACTGGSKSEQAIAKSIEANHSLKKFGYFFATRGPMMSVAKSLLRNNDEARRKRRSFYVSPLEDVPRY
ncbi:tropomodulin-2-like isoform X2 [Xenia sp. Carnegie-2017]|uniref:tropomodulin-2-like isoform X2 n=1 Tax=Xenia sp. Carnegie-2017 TaxID=2897299 RepID=UPI001F039800|nr:tropomodulin-2-like isoform X2 [Xenia sp. Carnegie-2017]